MQIINEPLNSPRVISILFLPLVSPWIKHQSYEKKKGNDPKCKKLLIVTQILLVTAVGNVQRTVSGGDPGFSQGGVWSIVQGHAPLRDFEN